MKVTVQFANERVDYGHLDDVVFENGVLVLDFPDERVFFASHSWVSVSWEK